MRRELLASGAPDGIVDDAVLVLSELLSNSYRHARPLSPDAAGPRDALAVARKAPQQGAEQGHQPGQQQGQEHGRRRGRERGPGRAQPQDSQDYVRAAWCRKPNGELTISVTDGGGPTRPVLATPSITARGGRGLSIITSLSKDWGVTEEDAFDGVTVWVVLTPPNGFTACPSSAVSGRTAAVNGRTGRRSQNGANGKHPNGKAALDLVVGFDDLA